MTPFERLKTLVKYNLSRQVLAKHIDMTQYSDCGMWPNTCHTRGCFAGWGTQCPALQAEGYGLDGEGNITIDGRTTSHSFAVFLCFFDLTLEESEALFGGDNKGTKASLRRAWADYLKAHPGIK